MVGWAKENAKASNLENAPIRWLVDDCVKFVEREIRRGNHYDAIIMDPPSYGRGPKGEIWKIEDSIFPFIQLDVYKRQPRCLTVILPWLLRPEFLLRDTTKDFSGKLFVISEKSDPVICLSLIHI